jgi:hypothetical protein
LPQGLPNHVPFHLIWGNDATKSIDKEKIINNRLSKYAEFQKMGMCKDKIYVIKLGSYVAYWESILKSIALSKFNPLGRFSPSNNWRFNHVEGAHSSHC